jgi:hypothetical protein
VALDDRGDRGDEGGTDQVVFPDQALLLAGNSSPAVPWFSLLFPWLLLIFSAVSYPLPLFSPDQGPFCLFLIPFPPSFSLVVCLV